MYDPLKKLKHAISPYKKYCDGYGNMGSSGNSYILALTIGVGVSDKSLSHPGSLILNEIDAFDKAEVDGPYIGQLNMSIVSSFCGPQGLVWGLDLFKHNDIIKDVPIKKISHKEKEIEIHSAKPLIQSAMALFGTVDNRKFILRPGAHVPFASKNKKIHGAHNIYAAIGIGIPKDRERNACLLMEDIGTYANSVKNISGKVFVNLAKSIIQVGLNQKVEYEKCYVAIRRCKVKKNQIGCALVAAPYFTIAQDALPKDILNSVDYNRIQKMNLDDWVKFTKKWTFHN